MTNTLAYKLRRKRSVVNTAKGAEPFGFSILLFTAFSVDDKSYRQVLTPVNNSQLLLKLEILDKFRLGTDHTFKHKGNYNIF